MDLVRALSFALLAMPASVVPLSGQDSDPLISDRPDFTESVAVVAPGALQSEAGYTFNDVAGAVDVHAIGELLLRLGLLERVELRLGLNSYVIESRPGDDASGFEDLFVGGKVRLYSPDPGSSPLQPQVAVLLGSSLPTGEEAFGSDELNPQAGLALAWSFSDRIGLGSNLNLSSLEAEGERFERFSGSASLGLGVAERLGAYLELFGFSKRSPDGSEDVFLNGGLTFLVDEDFQLDARTGLGLGDAAPDYFVGAGVAWRVRY